MTLLFGADSERPAALVDAELAARTPLGALSPLWGLYAATTGAGIAYWLMSRWMKPINLEALMAAAPSLPEPVTPPPAPLGGESAPIQSPAVAVAAIAEPLEALSEAVAEVLSPEPLPAIEAPAPEPVAPKAAAPETNPPAAATKLPTTKPRAPSPPRKI